MPDAGIAELRAKLQRLHEDYVRKSKQALAALEREERAIKREIAAKIKTAGQLKVLMRLTTGPAVTSYHSARYPCGRVTFRENYKELAEADAQGRGLLRCTACNWSRHEMDEAEHPSDGS
ncbi:hypothetical protein [Microbispora sp. NPDC049633]|uniref:hypothetical protein n=1 Tax=Microbispora sp. NPDC049633 TaxID=3154355 RepID=UPI00341E36B3